MRSALERPAFGWRIAVQVTLLSKSKRRMVLEVCKTRMEIFTNILDQGRFRSTNAAWNMLRLNDPWSVGYVSTLIESQPFSEKEEWETFYYESGRQRESLINELSEQERTILNDSLLKKRNPAAIDRLSWRLKELNLQYGRTTNQMAEKGRILFDHLQGSGTNITLAECIECVRFRTICETWNGIVIRERNTVATLGHSFSNVEFVKTTGAFDHQYAVDYEIFAQGKAVCGIQVKPKSYMSEAPYVKKAREANREKNRLYKQEFGRNVYDVIAESNGAIINKPIFQFIQQEIATAR